MPGWELRHQLIQLGKLVLGGDPDGTVAAEIRANKQLLDAMPSEEKAVFKELMQPDDQTHSSEVHILVFSMPCFCFCYLAPTFFIPMQVAKVTVVNRFRVKEDKKGVVYAVTSPLLNAIRIGHWNASPHSLDAQCRKFYGHDIQILTTTTSSPKAVEELLHRRFAEHHLSGSLYDKAMADAIFRSVRKPS